MSTPDWLSGKQTRRPDAIPPETPGSAARHPLLKLQQQVGNGELARSLADAEFKEHLSEPVVGADGGQLPPELAGRIDAERPQGKPLDSGTEDRMEEKVGPVANSVRIHADESADALSRSLGASAFTTGSDVFFRAGNYDPTSESGQALIAHELTHVQQQNGATTTSNRVGAFGESHEAIAESSARRGTAAPRQLHKSDMRAPGSSGSPVSAIQRAPHTAQVAPQSAGAGGPSPETAEDFVDFLQGINRLTVAADPRTHGAAVGTVSFGGHVSNDHLLLLEQLRSTLLLVYDTKPLAGHEALVTWDSIESDLRAGVRIAPKYVNGDLAAIETDLNYIGESLVRPAAYWDAHRRGLADNPVVAPDLANLQAQFDQQVEELKKADSISKDAQKLAAASIGAFAGSNKVVEVFELVKLPGEIGEKLREAKEKGIVEQTATAVELVATIAKTKTFVLEATFDFLKDRALKEAAKAATEELAEHWKNLAEGYEQYAKGLKTVGTVLGLVVAAVDLVRAFDAALHGKWEEAAAFAAKAGVGIFTTLVAGSTLPVTAIVVLTKIELEAIHMAAEFIRWCKDETVREAAQSFINDCVRVAKYPAADMLADLEAYLDPGNQSIQPLLEKQLTAKAKVMTQGLKLIRSNLECTEPSCLGGHQDLVAALGHDAREAIWGLSVPDDPFSMAEQVQVIFAGANNMAKYVHERYPTDTEKRFKESKEKKPAED